MPGTGWIGAADRLLAHDPAIRSISYSLVSWPLVAAGTFWSLAAATALCAAYALDLAFERLFGLELARRAAALLLVTAGTGLPWFVTFAMPDLFAGLLILATSVLVFGGSTLARGQRVGLWGLTVAAASFHLSHLLLLLALIPAAALLAPKRRLGLGILLSALVAIFLCVSLSAFFFGRASLSPRSPPFLLARQIEDGPALAYLRETCPPLGNGTAEVPWALCPVRERIWTNAEDFLWSPRDSYWAMRELREPMRAQETSLVLQAAMAHPWWQLRASLANALRQLASFGLDDFLTGRGALVAWNDYWFVYDDTVLARRAGLGAFTTLHYLTAGMALAFLAYRLARRDRAADRRLVGFVLTGIVVNAAICGALSGPHPRYQARVMWLVPVLAIGLGLARRPPVPPSPSHRGAGERPHPARLPLTGTGP